MKMNLMKKYKWSNKSKIKIKNINLKKIISLKKIQKNKVKFKK